MENAAKTDFHGSNWCFTLNNYTDLQTEMFKTHPAVKWSVVGKEIAPTTNTPHLQGYVKFTTKLRLTQVKKIFPTAHWEGAKGSDEDNFKYCTKGEDWFEIGTRPKFQHNGDREKERWTESLNAAKAGDWDAVHPQIMVQNFGNLQKINTAFQIKLKSLDIVKESHHERFWWIYGPTGTGKSVAAAKRFPEDQTYLKGYNKWWNGYQGEDHVVIDDFPNEPGLGQLLKLWFDVKPFQAETKGGSLPNRFGHGTITSNWHPAQIWTDKKLLEPIMRRFNVMYKGPTEQMFDPNGPIFIPPTPLKLVRSMPVCPDAPKASRQKLICVDSSDSETEDEDEDACDFRDRSGAEDPVGKMLMGVDENSDQRKMDLVPETQPIE